MKKIFKKIKKYLTNKYVKAVLYYTKYYDKTSKLKENEILLQSYDGSSISGNPYYLLIELCNNEEYKGFKKYVASNSKNVKAIKNIIKKEKLDNTEVISIHSRKYCKKLAEVKYLINNSTFATYFIKKEGQIYLNTWHGTPLKAMGRDIIETPHELGNSQRNLLMSDYLLYQNESMFNTMKNGYMLDNIYTGKYVISGYPRNDIFFSERNREDIRKELGLENKKVIVYMPTWRGTITCKQNEEQAEKITEMMDALQENLQEDTIVYCKIHNLASTKINYEKYKNIREFPKNYETYSVLNISDCLITDYSSVMVDYANLNKKIILYTYDYDEYTKDRGFYIDVKDTPFEMVNTIEELIEEVKNLDKKSDYSKFIEEYCNYDSKDISKKICKLLLKNDSTDLKIIDSNKIKNQKENILIFTGALLKNGITTALKGLINNIDLNEYNYYLTFSRKAVNGNCRVISSFPQECNYIPIQGQKNYRFIELIVSHLYFKYNIENKWIRKLLEKIYIREIKRVYPNIKFKIAIDFCGYDKNPINMISYMDATRIRYTHSNLKKEQETRSNIHIPSLKHSYRTYDKVVVIREGMEKEVQEHFEEIAPKCIKLVHNINDIENIIKNSEKELEFNDNTFSNYEIEEINNILNNKKYIKLINIGRFSEEKGQVRLIKAFKEIQEKNNDVYLFLVGGHGNKFDEIMSLIEKEEIKNIIVIKNLMNPFTILKRCNLFVLSSLYEGLPMTIMESLILNIPILSVDIEGPRKFLQQGYAYLVEDSQEGLKKGISDFINNKYEKLKEFDAEKFNEIAIQEFYELIKN